MESEMHITNSVGYETYINRQLDHKTFDIEHLLADKFNEVNSYLTDNNKVIFSTKEEFSRVRNSIGGLILLPRGRNRSLKDAMYSDKIGAYGTENILAQSLTDDFYKNQPNYSRFSVKHNITLKPFSIIDKDAIRERADIYENLARKLWSLEKIESIFGPAGDINVTVANDTE